MNYGNGNAFGPNLPAVVNTTTMRAVYPAASGRTVGGTANPSSNAGGPVMASTSGAAAAGGGQTSVDRAAAIGATGKPLVWWVILLVALVAGMIAARKMGGEGEKFAHISPGVYNVLVISFFAILGINFWKVVLTMFPIPGLSTLALNA